MSYADRIKAATAASDMRFHDEFRRGYTVATTEAAEIAAEADATIAQLLAALERIAAIEDKMVGPEDWDEIDEAREIARIAIAAARAKA